MINKLEENYLLVIFSLPININQSGRIFLDRLWVKDLVEHIKYFPRLTLASPVKSVVSPPDGFVAIDTIPDLSEVRWIYLPNATSMRDALFKLPRIITILWRELKIAKIVHSSIATWPIPEAWIITPMFLFRKRFHIIIVESAPWRLLPGVKNLRGLPRQFLNEYLGRICLRMAGLTIFTQEGYKKSLSALNAKHAHVIPASWIDSEIILDEIQIKIEWQRKADDEVIKIIYAGRLTQAKGLGVLLDSMLKISTNGVSINLYIIGKGEMKSDCEYVASKMPSGSSIKMIGEINYGPDFFNMLKSAHIIVVPSLSDEQPRIVFDAFSQGVPVIASKTTGLMECVSHQSDGLLVDIGSVESLSEAIIWASNNVAFLSDMGVRAAEKARSMTHSIMYSKRLALINNCMANR
jgi:glycosyltransferase involved in cell wall biosynthesis